MANHDWNDLQAALLASGSVTGAARMLGISRAALRTALGDRKATEMLSSTRDPEVREASVALQKRVQRLMDTNRIERKSFRNHARVENAVSAYAEEIRDLLTTTEFTPAKKIPKPKGKRKRPGLIVHWSDQHLNERVTLPHNHFDWNVAARRLRRHVHEAIRIGKAYEADSVFLAMTGDLLNSDRRIDELLANAGNRAKATVLAVDLYQQAIQELSEHFRVTVGSVSGNESRINKDLGWHAEVASDNFDFSIHEHLKLLFSDSPVEFLPIHDPGEMVVDVAGQHCLFIHGHGALSRDVQKSVQAAKGRWLERGVKVDVMFWGHLHEAMVADTYARSSSLVGSNDYAEKALNYTGRASQNVYVVLPEGGFHGIKVDLQEPGALSYNIQKRLEAYNTKSAEKCKPTETVHRIVI